jgi:hypothetical protein
MGHGCVTPAPRHARVIDLNQILGREEKFAASGTISNWERCGVAGPPKRERLGPNPMPWQSEARSQSGQ